MENKLTLFFSGTFNQCYPVKFTVDGNEYSSAEQFMMAMKAVIFKDFDMYERIKAENDPAIQKALGRQIVGFDKDVWEKQCKAIVTCGNLHKFNQNIALFYELRETEGTELVYAAANDTIWGVGLTENDSRILDKSQWLGTNWLGEILTEIRETLIREKKKTAF